MGTEIIVIFLPIPLVIWMYNVVRIYQRKNMRRHICLLLIGVGTVASVSSYVYFSGSPILQGVLVSSFFYLPYYMLCWVFLYILGALIPKSKLNASIT